MRFTDKRFYRPCTDCGRLIVLPPKRKCMDCKQTVGSVTTLRASNRGRNARGLAVHRPEKSRVKVKPYRVSDAPRPVTAYNLRRLV